MHFKTLKTAIVAALVAIVAMAIAPVHARSYGSGYGEYTRSSLQYCYPEYSRSYGHGDRIKRYTGYCFASFDRHGRPLYRYHQFRFCKLEEKSEGILSYYKENCGEKRYERRRHPDYRPPRYNDRYDRYDRYDRDDRYDRRRHYDRHDW